MSENLFHYTICHTFHLAHCVFYFLLAIWLLPRHWTYGDWPRSGEIDLLESHGNLNLTNQNGHQIGVQRVTAGLHFGPSWRDDAFKLTTFPKNNAAGFANDFHKYAFTWDHHGIRFFIDDIEIGDIAVKKGFWERGNFRGHNIWSLGDKMAPFDQEVKFKQKPLVYTFFSFYLKKKNLTLIA